MNYLEFSAMLDEDGQSMFFDLLKEENTSAQQAAQATMRAIKVIDPLLYRQILDRFSDSLVRAIPVGRIE